MKTNWYDSKWYDFWAGILFIYDTIAFTGMSGALLAPILASRLKKHY